MKKFALISLAAVGAAVLITWTSASTVGATVAAEETVTGRLVEAGCAAMGGAEPSAEHVACMVRCAKNGDPIGILTADGLIKITGDWAATHADALSDLMAKQVRATGETSEAGGETLLDVSTIELAK